MNLSERFRVNGTDIAHETIDGEVVIVNLRNGYYYSSDKAGAVIWNLLENGVSLGEVVDMLASRYRHTREEIERATKKLIVELRDEGLIVSAENDPPNGSPHLPSLDSEELQFVPPVLHKYQDMQNLLLLDPIHEVDEAGWPSTGENESGAA